MEDVSLAFDGVWRRSSKGEFVGLIHINRTVEVLYNYLEYVGKLRSREELRKLIDLYIEEDAKLSKDLGETEEEL
jgi:hypothetical protein